MKRFPTIALDPASPHALPAGVGSEDLAEASQAAIFFGDYQGRAGLRLNDQGRSNPITIDFQAGAMADRLAKASAKKEMIARACGVTPKVAPRVLDASAGLGRDAMILARCGAQMTLVERNPFLAMMLQDAIDDPAITLLAKDVRELSMAELQQFDTIYFDPMFPERKKAASVKLESQVLQAMHGGEEGDAEEVLAHLLAAKVHRTVVKRPVKAEELSAASRPNLRMRSGAMRYDVWLEF